MATIPVVGMPLQFKKMFAGPLTDDQIFDSMEAAEAFAASASFYPSAPISVKRENPDGTFSYTLYITQDDRTLKQQGDSVETVEQLQTQVTELRSKMTEIETEFATVKEKVSATETKVENNNSTSQEQTQQITNLSTTVQEQADQISQLNTTVETQGNTISEVKTKTELNEEAINRLSETHNDDIKEIEDDVELNAAAILELQAAMVWQEIGE